jgi:hypothetical protein
MEDSSDVINGFDNEASEPETIGEQDYHEEMRS